MSFVAVLLIAMAPATCSITDLSGNDLADNGTTIRSVYEPDLGYYMLTLSNDFNIFVSYEIMYNPTAGRARELIEPPIEHVSGHSTIYNEVALAPGEKYTFLIPFIDKNIPSRAIMFFDKRGQSQTIFEISCSVDSQRSTSPVNQP